MVMTIDIPEEVVARAAGLGVPLNEFICQTLQEAAQHPAPAKGADRSEFERDPLPPGFAYLGPKTRTRAEAAASIRDIASRSTLDGLKIKDLIEEDRRY